jgi:hypothetical protein
VNFRGIGLEGGDWMQLGYDRVRWRAVVNTEMNLLFP